MGEERRNLEGNVSVCNLYPIITETLYHEIMQLTDPFKSEDGLRLLLTYGFKNLWENYIKYFGPSLQLRL